MTEHEEEPSRAGYVLFAVVGFVLFGVSGFELLQMVFGASAEYSSFKYGVDASGLPAVVMNGAALLAGVCLGVIGARGLFVHDAPTQQSAPSDRPAAARLGGS